MTFQLLSVALMSFLQNFHSNEEQAGWLYSQAMVRFYTVGVGRERAVGRSSLLSVIIIHSKYFPDSDWLKARA